MMIHRHTAQRAVEQLGYLYGREQDQAQRRSDFRKIQRGTNFMSPDIAGMYRLKAKPQVIVEVSLGEFLQSDLVGCTVVDCATQEKRNDLNECLHSLDALADYFAKLEREFS